VASLDIDGDGQFEVVTGRDDGNLAIIESMGNGRFRVTTVFYLGGQTVDLALFPVGAGGDELLVALTANPDRVILLDPQEVGLPFSVTASVDLDEDPGGLACGPVGPAGVVGLVVTLPGSDRWLHLAEDGGEWGVVQEVLCGDRPVDIAVLELDGDPAPEIVTAENGVLSRSFTVFDQGGDNLYSLQEQLAAPGAPAYFCTAAPPGEVAQEVFVTFADSSFVCIFAAAGGSLVEADRIATAIRSDGVLVAPVPGADGALWAWNTDHGLVQYFQLQAGSWNHVETYYCGGPALDVTTMDLNNDLLPDLAIANGEISTVALLFGNDTPSFRAYLATVLPSSPVQGVVLDEDFDGHCDLLVACPGHQAVEFLRGDGHGHFLAEPEPLILDNPTRYLATLHADGDTLLDLALVQTTSSRVQILRRLAGGGYEEAGSVPTGLNPFRVLVSDFDGDGFADVVVGNETSDDLTLAFGAGDGTFTDVSTLPLTGSLRDLALLDINEDQLDDLAVTSGSGGIATLLNLGGRVFGQAYFYAVAGQPLALATADMDDDNDLDLAVGTQVGGSLTVFANLGTGFLIAAVESFDLEGIPGRLALEDIDLNGLPDVLVTYPDLGEVGVVLNAGVWLFAPPVKFFAAVEPLGLAVGDFNEDDFPDIVTLDLALELVLTLLNIEPNPLPVTAPDLTVFCRPAAVEVVFRAPGDQAWVLEGKTATGWVTLAAAGVARYGSLAGGPQGWSLFLSPADAAAGELTSEPDGQVVFRLTLPASGVTVTAGGEGDCLFPASQDLSPFEFATPFPNPFNPEIRARFVLARPARVEAFVWDLAGRRVARLVAGDFPAGEHWLGWDGQSHGRPAGAGTYLLTVTANGRTLSRKVTLLK